MKYYIHDTTIGKYVYFNQINELVSYFNQLIPRIPIPNSSGKHFKNRGEYAQYLSELGHGYDDSNGWMITRVLSEQFNIGVVRNDGSKERTNIHEASSFLKEEYGD